MRRILVGFLIACAWPALAAVAIVQNKPNSSTANAATLAVSVTSTTSNLIVVGAGKSGDTDTITSVTDNIGNTYVQASNARGVFGTIFSDVWYCLGASSGVTTVTIHYGTASVTNKQAEVWEVSGFITPVFDLASHGAGAGAGNLMTGAAITTTSTNGFIVAIGNAAQGTVDQNPNSGNAFTSGGDILGGGMTSMGAVSLISTTAASHNAVWHNTTATPNFTNSIAAFKESAAAPTIVGHRPLTF